ncbi:MAG: single-stranded DNA-binding protein [Desulfobacteraceae bacterium]|nr:single-stranded DNA-binding protein [Desulfobacteraceae bacterium]
MSNDLNQCQFIGRLGKDPEVRFTPDNKPIANITLAVGESWKDRNTGQKQEKTEWVRIVFFGGVAQVAADYLKKGSKIYVSGKQKTRKWQDQSGQDKYTTEIVVDGFSGVMQMLGARSDNNTPQQSNAPQQPSQPKQQAVQQQDQPFEDDLDVPF